MLSRRRRREAREAREARLQERLREEHASARRSRAAAAPADLPGDDAVPVGEVVAAGLVASWAEELVDRNLPDLPEDERERLVEETARRIASLRLGSAEALGLRGVRDARERARAAHLASPEELPGRRALRALRDEEDEAWAG